MMASERAMRVRVRALLGGAVAASLVAGAAIAQPGVSPPVTGGQVVCDPIQQTQCARVSSSGQLSTTGGSGAVYGQNGTSAMSSSNPFAVAPGNGSNFEQETGGNAAATAASTATDATNNSAFQGQTPTSGGMVAGTTYAAGRSIFVVATGAGTLNLVLPDGSTLPYPIAGAGPYQLPFAVTQIATSSTAPFSYASNLK